MARFGADRARGRSEEPEANDRGARRGGARREGAAAAAVGGEVEEGHVAAGVEDAGRRRARRARRKTGRGGGVSLVRRDEEEKRRGIEGERGFERGRWDRAERGAVTALRGYGGERLDRGIRLGFG